MYRAKNPSHLDFIASNLSISRIAAPLKIQSFSQQSAVPSQTEAHSLANRFLAEIFTSSASLAMAWQCRAQIYPRGRDNRGGQGPKPRPRTKTVLNQESRVKTRNPGSTPCKERSEKAEQHFCSCMGMPHACTLCRRERQPSMSLA